MQRSRFTRGVTFLLAAAALAMPMAGIGQQTAPGYVGFDRNDYPGDDALPELRKHFAFTGYWLTNPPGETQNSWKGKRELLVRQGFGFLVVANGRLDKEILRSIKQGKPAAALAQQDASVAIAAAKREGFPARTVLFVDQEEGGGMLQEQADYLLAWTEAVSASEYLPGIYASGQPVPNGPGPDGKPTTITSIQDIRARVAAGRLHPIAFWVAQDACPPSNGCLVTPPPVDASGTPDPAAWQYAQSPRRKNITQSCGKTYNADGNCYTPAPARFDVDLSVAASPDPSHGR